MTTPLEEASCQALDNYLLALQEGKRPDRGALLELHPHLAGYLDCLDDLNQLVPDDTDALPTLAHAGAPSTMGPSVRDFGPFEVEAELGRGGMGVVYKAREKGLDRPVALKMILAGQLASPEDQARFQAEARVAARLQHPHIVSIYQVGDLHGQPFISMQYIAGPSLAAVLRQEVLSFERAAEIVLQVAQAVAHLHRNGILHRDLKPSNILLNEQGQAYVTDFGLVKLLADDSHRTQTGVVVGTPSYMAPEQAAGRSQKLGPACDIYGLGAILFEILTGRPPFKEDTPLDTLVQVLEGEPTRPRILRPDIPRDLERICMRCLEKSPQGRYPSAEDLVRDLEHFLREEPIESPAPSPLALVVRWARREPALVSRLAMLGVCLVLAQISYFFAVDVTPSFHLTIIAGLVLWALTSWVCQWALNQPSWAESARFLWAGLDVVFFSSLLIFDEAFHGPLIIGFPLLIAASGLWFRTDLVWFTTGCVGISYLAILALEPRWEGLHKHLMFLGGLGILGFITAYQVQRVRALSRYYERRPLP